VLAFGLSILLHLLLLGVLEGAKRHDWWRYGPIAHLAKVLRIDLGPQPAAERMSARPIETPAREAVEEMPTLFVDVDPSQASAEPVPKTPYYGAVNSLAANRDTSRDLEVPELDGTQDRVRKTMESERARPHAAPMQPARVMPQQPSEGPAAEPVRPQAVVATQRPVAEPAPVEPAAAPSPAGETLMAKANPVATKPPGVAAVVGERPRVRPRTVAAALAERQLNPNSALLGEKLRQEGGVRRFSIASSLNVQASPLGNYDAKFVAAVQQCWYGLLEEQQYSLDRMGKVVIEFRLMQDGRITEMKVVESDVGAIYTTLCEVAIHKPAPYERWPVDVRKMVGVNYRDVRFTFYY